MPEENMHQEFRLKKTDEIRNYLIEEIISKKHKKFCRVLNYIPPLLIVISRITWCVSISTFVSLVAIPIGIISSVIGSKICVITSAIKRFKSIIKKKKKHNNTILLLS